jgi:hypothetical protein
VYRWLLCWDPIDREEQLLRLIPKDWHRPKNPIPFGKIAFQPRDNDEDGLSLYREKWVTAHRLVSTRRSPEKWFVVRLKVKDILAIKVTVKVTVGDLPGHVVIPEMNTGDYKKSPNQINEWALSLTKIASQDIVLRPP